MTSTGILAVGVGVVLLLPLVWRVLQRRFDPFEPIVVFALAWGVMFVVRPLAMLIRDDLVFFGVDISSTLDEAVLLALVGAVGFTTGYSVRVGKRLAGSMPLVELGRPSWVLRRAWVAGVIGLVALVTLLLVQGGLGAVGTYLSGRGEELDALLDAAPLYLWWLSLLVVPVALAAFAVALTSPAPSTVVAAVALIGLALVRTLPTGSRLNLLVLLGGMIVFVYLQRRRRPGLPAIAIGLLAAIAISHTILTLRYEENRSSISTAIDRLASMPSRVLTPAYRGADSEMAPALAGALLVIPEDRPYRFGAATFGDLVTRPLPRGLWSEKPLPHTHQMTTEVWPEARERGRFDPAYTPLMSFYWDFGVLGVVLGMALYGAVARMAYEFLLRAGDSAVAHILYAAALWSMVTAIRSDPVLLVMHVAIVLVPLLAITARPRRIRELAEDTRPSWG